ncbi:MAG: hypothetical protein IJG80_07710 [Selenomonadaceae bacterium]|nr:hypothetical protein [Selenomonadaceae bacterium]MBQ3726582.1 hypothetical protein [Selenomonadaceae bacterium]MBQ9497311.1 hypothetical protein [Selenomonadaceae bacterium]
MKKFLAAAIVLFPNSTFAVEVVINATRIIVAHRLSTIARRNFCRLGQTPDGLTEENCL